MGRLQDISRRGVATVLLRDIHSSIQQIEGDKGDAVLAKFEETAVFNRNMSGSDSSTEHSSEIALRYLTLSSKPRFVQSVETHQETILW